MEHFLVKITPEENWETFYLKCNILWMRHWQTSSVALYFVSQLASKHVKVVLFQEKEQMNFLGGITFTKNLLILLNRNVHQDGFVYSSKIAKALPFNFLEEKNT
ncbi:hypothetical protein AN640_07700 [Candidatus Epulonipiscium fishelsonii]|uniref:Uncharacterized protein n=1 Tax=Candidatus Epulonipiscium fishelsonii TaxID=77094 RepID=A0ACC8XEX0_9FIRM|nr:hypothetical protein AN640_07700 [Epulopiscium sp. SCG-D08WGA-EpuloA1]